MPSLTSILIALGIFHFGELIVGTVADVITGVPVFITGYSILKASSVILITVGVQGMMEEFGGEAVEKTMIGKLIKELRKEALKK